MYSQVLSIINIDEAIQHMRSLGVDERGVRIMALKSLLRIIKLGKIPAPAANILKQEMLSLGGEAALPKDVLRGKLKVCDCLLLGTLSQFERLFPKLKDQPFNLEKISQSIKETLSNFSRCEFQLEIGGLKLNLGKRTFIMGILNLTPDSFSGDGIYKNQKSRIKNQKFLEIIIEYAERMIKDGADIIDVGGESTRPGAKSVSVNEEMERVIPAIRILTKRLKVPISIDTNKSEVAEAALDAGAAMVNDIRGLKGDTKLAKVIARRKVPVVVMHIKGTPRTMQRNPQYKSLIQEIISSLRRSIQIGLNAGIKMEKIIVDPGIGFGKTTEHNLEILKRLSEFRSLGRPILVGTSRKSFIGNTLGLPVEERLVGSAATVALAILNGADIVRVHDVKEMAQVARMADAIIRSWKF